MIKRRVARESLDAAHSGRHGTLGDDSEEADVAGARDMGAATQFRRPASLAHGDHPHLVAVAFAEECQSTGTRGLVGSHQPGGDFSVHPDHPIDLTLDRPQRVLAKRRRMTDVEAQSVGGDERALLGDVIAEVTSQGLVQQMGRRVGGPQPPAPVTINGESHMIAGRQVSLIDVRHVEMHVANAFLGIRNGGADSRARKASLIADLPSRFGVEG